MGEGWRGPLLSTDAESMYPWTVNGVRTDPRITAEGHAPDDLPVIGVPCNRQVCRWLNLQHHRGNPKGPVKGLQPAARLDTRAQGVWLRGLKPREGRRLPASRLRFRMLCWRTDETRALSRGGSSDVSGESAGRSRDLAITCHLQWQCAISFSQSLR